MYIIIHVSGSYFNFQVFTDILSRNNSALSSILLCNRAVSYLYALLDIIWSINFDHGGLLKWNIQVFYCWTIFSVTHAVGSVVWLTTM